MSSPMRPFSVSLLVVTDSTSKRGCFGAGHRWRQILNEADRIEKKRLLTIQEGVSGAQFREMVNAKVQLVVPTPLKKTFPSSIQEHLQTIESFVADVRLLPPRAVNPPKAPILCWQANILCVARGIHKHGAFEVTLALLLLRRGTELPFCAAQL